MSEKEIRKIEDVLKDENIVDFKKLHENIDYVFSKISDSISKTLGPGGGYTLISNMDNSSPIYPTKDGFTLIQEFKFNDQINFFIAEIIKDISRRMNVNVGDSTTSGIIIAYKLYSDLIKYDITKLYEKIGCTLPPVSIRIILETIRVNLTEKLMKNSNYILKNIPRDIENKYIEKVATISANNDIEIGKMVSDLFTSRETNHVFVTTEVGTADETIIEKEVGFQFGSGFINPIMANQLDRITCKLKNPKFFIVDGPLTLSDLPSLNMIIDYVLEDLKLPIVLVAKDYDQPVLNMLVERCTETVKLNAQRQPYKHEKEPIAALTINADYERSRDRLEDLRILLGCEIVETKKGKIIEFKNNTDFINKFLGGAEEFSGTQLSTRVKRGQGDKTAIIERIKFIEERIKEIDLNEGILAFTTTDNLRRRISMMNSDMSIIKVGGANDKERRAKKLIFDDAVLACISAVDSGISLGGNINIPHYINKNIDELVKEITNILINQSKHIVVGNKYEDVSLIVKDILNYVSEAFKAAYTVAIENMVGKGTISFKNITDKIYNDGENLSRNKPCIFNLVTGEYVNIESENTIPVPANTDFELMSSVFGVIGTLISSNQFLSILPGSSTVYNKTK